ncbi:hypothetical protein Tco_0315098 [Tanacetum coccineum]
MSEAASGGAALYEPTLEMFDSKSNKWTVMGSMPVEFAVRLTGQMEGTRCANGPDVKAFLSHVKPALLSAVEAL